MHFRRIILPIILAIVMMAVPRIAHADAAGVVNSFFNNALGLSAINFGLDLVRGLVTFVIGQVSFILQSIIHLQLGGGGDVVYTVWKNLRDFCNMGFIVILILMSFGTIFDIFKWPFISAYSINSKGVIAGFLSAAIFMNFSLAVGQVVAGLSDQVTTSILRILPSDGISQLLGQLEIATLSTDPSISDQILLSNDVPADAQKVFQDCIIKTPSALHDCYQQAIVKAVPAKPAGTKPSSGLGTQIVNGVNTGLRETGRAVLDLTGTTDAVIGAVLITQAWDAAQQAGNATTIQGSVTQIIGKVYSIFLLLAALLSFVVVAIFMFIRIPVMWVLLAISPIAFLSLAIPQSDNFKKWWGEIVTWSIFGPLYLLVIYFGMFMVRNMGLMVAALGSGNNPPIIAGFLAPLLNFIVVGIIFIGGAGAVHGIGKGGGKFTSGVIGGITEKLGVTGTYGAIGTAAMGVSRVTGAQPYIEAGRARITQTKKDIGSELAGRYPKIFGGSAEALAKAKQRLGVREGNEEREKVLKSRVDEQQVILKAQKATDPQLLDAFTTSQNTNKKLAAGEILLKKGQLTDVQRKALLDLYGTISSTAKDTFQKTLTEQVQKEARGARYADFDELKSAVELVGKKSEDRRKFLTEAMAGEAGQKLFLSPAQLGELTNLIGDTNDKRVFLEATAKVSRNKLAAIEKQVDLGLLVDRNGKKIPLDQAVDERADSFSLGDILDSEDYLAANSKPMPPALDRVYKKALNDREKSSRLIKGAVDANQLARIHYDMAGEAARAQTKEITLDKMQQTSRNLLTRIKNFRDAAKREDDRARKEPNKTVSNNIKKRRDKWQILAKSAEARQEKLKDKIDQLRKSA